MICFLMRMDKRLRVQLFFLALIVVSERFAEGDDSSTVPAPAGKKCYECRSKECDDPDKVKTQDCAADAYCATLIEGNRSIRKCSSAFYPEAKCVVDFYPEHCYFPKSNPDQLEKVLDCAKKINAMIAQVNSANFDKACFCDGDLCNDKNLPPVEPGVTGGTSTTEASGGSTTANSTSVRIHTRPFIPFSLAIETIVVAAGLKMNV